MRVPTRPNNIKRARLLGVLVCLFTVPAVQAADGRIMFSGAVTAPTCALAAINVAKAVNQLKRAQRKDCPGKHGKPSQDPREYRMTVTQLPGNMVDSRVQTYFNGYVAGRGTGGDHTLLATQTYD